MNFAFRVSHAVFGSWYWRRSNNFKIDLRVCEECIRGDRSQPKKSTEEETCCLWQRRRPAQRRTGTVPASGGFRCAWISRLWTGSSLKTRVTRRRSTGSRDGLWWREEAGGREIYLRFVYQAVMQPGAKGTSSVRFPASTIHSDS